jgi:hypothetical protein
MSNSASLSAAKRRRGGMPPPTGQQLGQPGQPIPQGQPQMFAGSNGLPPGLPANFRQLPQQAQQQLVRQLQQKMGTSAPGIQPTIQKQNTVMPPSINTRSVDINVPNKEPYVVNSVIHNNAMSELNGLSLHDLPITSAGLPCLPSGRPLPPNVLFKLHHDDLLQKDIALNDISHRIHLLSVRVDKSENIHNSSSVSNTTHDFDDTTKSILVNDSDFISKIVDNILTNTNLSDIINQIEPLQKENESLRLLINSQQKTLNELSGLVMKLMNSSVSSFSTANTNTNTTLGINVDRQSDIIINPPADETSIENYNYIYNPEIDTDINSSVYIPSGASGENDDECGGEYIDEQGDEHNDEQNNE